MKKNIIENPPLKIELIIKYKIYELSDEGHFVVPQSWGHNRFQSIYDNQAYAESDIFSDEKTNKFPGHSEYVILPIIQITRS